MLTTDINPAIRPDLYSHSQTTHLLDKTVRFCEYNFLSLTNSSTTSSCSHYSIACNLSCPTAIKATKISFRHYNFFLQSFPFLIFIIITISSHAFPPFIRHIVYWHFPIIIYYFFSMRIFVIYCTRNMYKTKKMW